MAELGDGVVVLREPAEHDLGALERESADPETLRWLNISEDPAAAAREYLAWARERDPTRHAFAIADAATDDYLGGLVLFYNARVRIAEVGYSVAPEARGRGIAVRGLHLACRFAFDQLGAQRIELRTHPDNAASIRVAEKAGFTREGIERSSREIRGRRHDAVCFSLLPDD